MKGENNFSKRLEKNWNELKWLYMELYNDMDAFDYFLRVLRHGYDKRKDSLRDLDAVREGSPNWYKKREMLGMQLYVEQFAGTLKGVKDKLPYISECGVNYIHLMPILESPEGKSDGGYAVSNYRKVQPSLGDMEDLEALCDSCRERGVSVCLDFVMNHTSDEHEWAKKAYEGVPGYRDRYFFYDDWSIPDWYQQTMPEVFPTTAPGSFTQLPNGLIVMTNFYPYQWDLNYHNPTVLNDMAANMFYIINRGVDVIRLDAIPYIWKELGTPCRNLPQVHIITRILRIACDIACPGVLLLGEVVMEPSKVAPYFGTPEKPECNMLYNVTTMATTWHTIATRDTSLLKNQMKIVYSLPKEFVFLNYLRCHDDIGWGLDYNWLKRYFNIDEVSHKKFLNYWFTGLYPYSNSRGELYNDDAELGDARLTGTTASFTGIQTALESGDKDQIEQAIACDLMLHAWVISLAGVPVLYSGDEVAQLNDYSYHKDAKLSEDSRYLHRGRFNWEEAKKRSDESTYIGRVFKGLRKIENARAAEPCFDSNADVWVEDNQDTRVIILGRYMDGRELYCVYNFTPYFLDTRINKPGSYTDILGGENFKDLNNISMWPYGFYWLLKDSAKVEGNINQTQAPVEAAEEINNGAAVKKEPEKPRISAAARAQILAQAASGDDDDDWAEILADYWAMKKGKQKKDY